MSRNFGIEIELKGVSITAATDHLWEAGLLQYGNPQSWKVTTDSSVDYGIEVVSPILNGENGIKKVEKVVGVLKKLGGFVDGQCGIHVHVDGTDLTSAMLANIVKRYAQFEEQIDAWIHPSRRNDRNEHACSVKNLKVEIKSSPQVTVRGLGRRYKVNIASFLKHGTVEFRHHHGSLDEVELRNWIHFCVQFVENSKCTTSEVTHPGDGSLRKNAIERKFFAMIKEFVSGFTVSKTRLAEVIGCSIKNVPCYISKFRAWMQTYDVLRTHGGEGYSLSRYYESEVLAHLDHPGLEKKEIVINFGEPGLLSGLAQEVQEHFLGRTTNPRPWTSVSLGNAT